jgi:hypothetical protein
MVTAVRFIALLIYKLCIVIQGDYKRYDRLRKFIGMKVITTQKLNAYLCEEQLIFTRMRNKQFQLSPLEYSTDVIYRLIHRDRLELRLLPPATSRQNQTFHNMTGRHGASTVRWQHSWIGSCHSDGSARGGTTSWPPRSPHLTPSNIPVGFCERWGLRSANAYNPEQIEGSNMNSDRKTWPGFSAKCLARSRISPWCGGQQMKHILNLHSIRKKKLV